MLTLTNDIEYNVAFGVSADCEFVSYIGLGGTKEEAIANIT